MAGRSRARARLLVCALAVACVAGCAKQPDDSAAPQQIQQVLDTYLRSVKTADADLASTFWLHSPEVDVISPLGRYHGWESIRKDVYIDFLQKGFLERDLQISNVHIHASGNSAWSAFDWSFTGKLANGQPMASKGRESHVYERVDGAWRITQLHYSGLLPPQ